MKKILISLLVCLVFSCELSRAVFGHGRHPLSFKRTPYTGNVATNGAYCNKNLALFCLYRNGVFLTNGTGSHIGIDSTFAQMLLYSSQQYYQRVPYWWGVYKIEGDSLWMDGWMSGDMDYPTYLYCGKVINDTTLFIYNYPTGPDTFRFRAMPVKPDSTNRFID